jgi:Tfp pilus assembly protein PilF
MANIFAVQDTISRAVAEALNAALLGTAAPANKRETTPEAYNNYMMGRHFQDLFGKENLAKAEEYFQKAISIDPAYAPTWDKLARVHTGQADRSYIPLDIGYRKATEEIGKALELDPGNADAYAGKGWIKNSYEWDWSGADDAYRRALALEPRNRAALNGAAALASTLGRFDESIALYHRVIEIDPLWPTGYYNLGNELIIGGIDDAAEAPLRKCLELNPSRPLPHLMLGRMYMDRGKLDSAAAEMMRETEPSAAQDGLVLVYYAQGKKKQADSAFAVYIKENQDGSAFQIAEIYGYLGETDKAFEWLERAYIQRDGGLADVKLDPLLKSIRKDPRYKEFMKKMKLPL